MDAALEAAEKAIASDPDDYGLCLFTATLYSRKLQLDRALPHAQRAMELAPGDPLVGLEVVRILMGLGRTDEAEHVLDGAGIQGLEPLRLKAMILARKGQSGVAAQLLRQVVEADPRDHESWANLGECCTANAQPRRAVEAFANAARLRPDLARYRDRLVKAQVVAGAGEEALTAALHTAAVNPGSADALVTVARLQALLDRREEAIETLRKTLAIDPKNLTALVEFAMLLERQNAIAKLGEVVEVIGQLDPASAQLPLLKARLAFRQGNLKRSLELANAAPEYVNADSRWELLGMIHDRLGNADAAFAAFERMNHESELSERSIGKRSAALRDLVDYRAQLTTPEWVAGWSASDDSSDVPSPAFVIGFPRSGTTLLDSFLMGHADVRVAEEKPILQAVGAQLADFERIESLDEAELRALQLTYFDTAKAHVPDWTDELLIDKYPLGAIDIALIHRVFPSAKIIFTQRHPYDVVLSCFVTQFQLSQTLISFLTLEDSVKLYDRVMTLWERSLAAMNLNVHVVRYENLVTDPEAEMRRLVTFLELDWHEAAADHLASARNRSFVDTASYAQVVEPLYDRSIGRWKRYRRHLEPVIPILKPWAVKMGYEV